MAETKKPSPGKGDTAEFQESVRKRTPDSGTKTHTDTTPTRSPRDSVKQDVVDTAPPPPPDKVKK